jgi:hypothetical protein
MRGRLHALADLSSEKQLLATIVAATTIRKIQHQTTNQPTIKNSNQYTRITTKDKKQKYIQHTIYNKKIITTPQQLQ